jgi:hypothetical protein
MTPAVRHREDRERSLSTRLVATLFGFYPGGLDDRPPLLDLRLLELA